MLSCWKPRIPVYTIPNLVLVRRHPGGSVGQQSPVELNRQALTLRTPADARWSDIETRLNAEGCTLGWLPPVPNSPATIGNILEQGRGGLRSALYGHPGQCCIAVKAVLANGAEVEGRTTPRSAAGPDWKHALIGGQRTTGRITQALLRVFPLPKHRGARVGSFHEIDAAIKGITLMLHRGAIPSVGICFPLDGKFVLWLFFEGLPSLTDARVKIAEQQLSTMNADFESEAPFQSWLEMLVRYGLHANPAPKVSPVQDWSFSRGSVPDWLHTLFEGEALIFGALWQDISRLIGALKARRIDHWALSHFSHSHARLLVSTRNMSKARRDSLGKALSQMGAGSSSSAPAADALWTPVCLAAQPMTPTNPSNKTVTQEESI